MLETHWASFLNPKDPLIQERKKGWDRFQQIGLPRPKQEAFQYLLKPISFPPLAERKGGDAPVSKGLLFVDGFFDPSLSNIPAPLVCLPLEKAIRSYALFLQNRLSKMIGEEKDPFAALNTAFQGGGAFLYVPPNGEADLEWVQVQTSNRMGNPRLHIYLGKNSHLRLKRISKGKEGFSNGVLDFVSDCQSQFSFFDEGGGDFEAVRGVVKRESRAKIVLLGNRLRTSIHIELAEEKGEVELYGLSRLGGDEESHVHANVEHRAPYTRSRQHFKTVLKEKSRFSFEGKIHVRPEAQKTEAYQLSNNLILSDEASANAKPNLEIFADDVKASHGATFGQIDEEQLFYLRSRGLSLEQASGWLIDGFCQEILDHAR